MLRFPSEYALSESPRFPIEWLLYKGKIGCQKITWGSTGHVERNEEGVSGVCYHGMK